MAEGFKDIMNKLDEIKNDMNKQIQSLDLKVSNFQEQLNVFVNKIESLEAENKELNNEFKISKAFLWGLRRENKANNLILYNVPNINDSTSQELETKIMIFLQNVLKANVSLQDIDQIRKIGRKEAQRPVLKVLKLSGNLKGTKISISQDYLYEVRQVRKQLLPYLHKARNMNCRAFLRYDKLIINNESYFLEQLKQLEFDVLLSGTTSVTSEVDESDKEKETNKKVEKARAVKL
uniref:Uncharacterized protein n=1 Tax=Rhodnius prolixus TaxID=13249 RepID=T1HTZ2_RHOPR